MSNYISNKVSIQYKGLMGMSRLRLLALIICDCGILLGMGAFPLSWRGAGIPAKETLGCGQTMRTTGENLWPNQTPEHTGGGGGVSDRQLGRVTIHRLYVLWGQKPICCASRGIRITNKFQWSLAPTAACLGRHLSHMTFDLGKWWGGDGCLS